MLTYEKVISASETSFAAYLRSEETFPFAWHYHPEFELVAITESQGRRFIGDDVDDYGPNELTLTGPNLPHNWQSIDSPGKQQEAIVVQFKKDFLGTTLFDHDEFRTIRHLLVESVQGLYFKGAASDRIIERLQKLISMDSLHKALELLSILNELGSINEKRHLSSEGFTSSRNIHGGERINKAFGYMYDHCTEPIRQDDVAELVNMSRAGFSRFFKRCTGRSFVDCLADIRIGQACRMLIDTDLTITEICFRTGFRNISNFNRQFLKHKKISPRKYKQQHK